MAPQAFHWGIISTGGIATAFVQDLLLDPKTRDVHDVIHKVVAVGSRKVETAQEFIAKVAGGDTSIQAYGTYEEVYADSNVHAIYIGTPHTYHFLNAIDAIRAKKHVLCEKPVTSNAAELRALLAAAKENQVFFMEALWTSFHPAAQAFRKLAHGDTLGKPIMVNADLSGNFKLDKIDKTHRILNPDLGGGALLDLGPYPLVWALMALYEHPDNHRSKPSSISGSMLMTPLTNVDCNTSFTLVFDKLAAQAVLGCSINVSSGDPGATIRFEKGAIKIARPLYCPLSFTVEYNDENHNIVKEEKFFFDNKGRGMHFQADEVAQCVAGGRLESSVWTHAHSEIEMIVFDEVRQQGGYKFPPGVEKVL
ncbi:hypothetical protein C8J56DRAFT_971858 [Mycena floridula]|nr:hypothetical protein C8J56DRAFT_971858 [Mycena floridula]